MVVGMVGQGSTEDVRGEATEQQEWETTQSGDRQVS